MTRILRPDTNCVDVGAHSGAVLREMVRLAPEGEHLAVEPLPNFAAVLRDEFGPSVRVEQLAAGDDDGVTDCCSVETNPAYSGMREPDPKLRPGQRCIHFPVRVRRLDELVDPTLDIGFINVDVEGAELDVFQGALKTIHQSRPFIAFKQGPTARTYGVTSREVYDFLTYDAGYRISLLDRWLEGRPPLRPDEFRPDESPGDNIAFLAHPD
jgi:FkbM family methyltransferase